MLRAVLPDMMRWLWRDQPVSTDPKNAAELSYVAAKGVTGNSVSDDAPLLDAEQKWVDALMNGDPAALGTMLSAQYVDTDEDGHQTDKKGVIAAFKSGDLKIASIKLSDMKVSLYGDFAVVTGAAAQSGTFQGHPLTPKIVFTDTFEFQGGRWMPVASHRSAPR